MISASGMCEQGRILHHLRNNIEDPRNTVLITGFQAQDTLGRKLVEKWPEVRIFGEPMRVRAEVASLDELSAHADQNELLEWVEPHRAHAAQGVPGARRTGAVGDPGRAAALALRRGSGRVRPPAIHELFRMSQGHEGETEKPAGTCLYCKEAKGVFVRESHTDLSRPPPQRSGLLTALVAGAIIALVAANIYMYIQMDHLRTDMAKVRESLMTEVSNLRDASTVTTASQTRHLETLKEELEARRRNRTRRRAPLSSQAKAEASAHAEQLAQQIRLKQAKRAAAGQQRDQRSQAEPPAAANAKIADVATEVGGVKTQVSATQAELQKTIADLKSARGDLGVQSGLIATNATNCPP